MEEDIDLKNSEALQNNCSTAEGAESEESKKFRDHHQMASENPVVPVMLYPAEPIMPSSQFISLPQGRHCDVEPVEILPTEARSFFSKRESSVYKMLELASSIEKQVISRGGTLVKSRNPETKAIEPNEIGEYTSPTENNSKKVEHISIIPIIKSEEVEDNIEEPVIEQSSVELMSTTCKCGETVTSQHERCPQCNEKVKRFMCKFCPKKFARSDLAQRHAKHQHPSLTIAFVCDQCSFRTRNRGLYDRHLMRHQGIKFCECQICDYKTNTPKCLRIHMLTHTGEKPFNCHLCDYRATQRGHLRDHLRLVHLKTKEFGCEFCGSRFGIKGALQRHIKNMHQQPTKLYKCPDCDYQTQRHDRLKEHSRTHNGDKPFKCTMCTYKTASRQSMNKHARLHLKRAVKALRNNSSATDSAEESTSVAEINPLDFLDTGPSTANSE